MGILFLRTFVDASCERSQVYYDLLFVKHWLVLNRVAHELFKLFVHLHLELFELRYLLSLILIF